MVEVVEGVRAVASGEDLVKFVGESIGVEEFSIVSSYSGTYTLRRMRADEAWAMFGATPGGVALSLKAASLHELWSESPLSINNEALCAIVELLATRGTP